MDKELALELIKLLSALESWGYSNKMMLPDFLAERLSIALDVLTKEVLRDK
jgi:hypothetical protein